MIEKQNLEIDINMAYDFKAILEKFEENIKSIETNILTIAKINLDAYSFVIIQML